MERSLSRLHIMCLITSAVLAWQLAGADTSTPGETASTSVDYQEIVETIAGNVEARYPIEVRALEIAKSLRSEASNGEIIAVTDETAFIEVINQMLWEAAHDLHLRVYSEKMLDGKYRKGGGRVPRMRQVDSQRQGGTQQELGPLGNTEIRGEMIEPGIGLITIDSALYRNPEEFSRALGNVSKADHLILDIRQVPGGTPPGVQAFLSNFYGKPTHIFSSVSRDSAEPREMWTSVTPLSETFATKDLYLLTSKKSASGAEAVAFGLKNTGRATLIGETTAGAGNAGAFLQLGSGLSLFLPISQTINPVTGEAWEGKGVAPHISAQADQALEVALKSIS